MNLASIQNQLTLFVEGLCFDAQDATGNPVIPVVVDWGRQPQKIHTGPFVLAYLGPIVQIGHDEKFYRYNDLTLDLEEYMVGVRRMTVRLSFRSFDQRLGYSARQYAEDFRILTQSSTTTDMFHSFVNLALIRTGELVESDYEWSGRMVSQVDLDVEIGVRAELENKSYDGGFIKNVNIEGQSYIIDELGNPVKDRLGNPLIPQDHIEITVSIP